MIKSCAAISLCLAALAFPAIAGAVVCAPPGTSGVDQYFETIPGASCSLAPPGSGVGGGGGASAGGGGGQLSPAASRRLAAQGPAGRAVAELVASTGPPLNISAGRSGRSAEAGGGGGSGSPGGVGAVGSTASSVPPSGDGQNPLAGLLAPIVSGSAPGGAGVLLPIFLAATLLLALAAGIVRRRRRS